MIKQFLLSLLLIQAALVAGKGKGGHHRRADPTRGKKWLNLNGGEPIVVAKGGFSGLAPDSSLVAYTMALQASLANTILYCDLQYTKDLQAFCLSGMNLENSTTITESLPGVKPKTYKVNGKDMTGFFAVDFTMENLAKNVYLMQRIFSRSPEFDGTVTVVTPYDVISTPGSKLWLNVEYPSFYEEHKINAASYVKDTMADLLPVYISSTEVAFLQDMAAHVDKATTKLFLKINSLNDTEPTTQKTYATLLTDPNSIKAYASGVVLPKDSIWPIDAKRYLLPATTYVSDLHKAGLEVFASGFANDNYLSYNYSYDPTKEYLQFIDNSQFSVDGVLTEFPPTASEAIACGLANPNATRLRKALIISHDGASGDYPGCTDLAYQKAIDDGADIIDCSVQMSKDGVAFCLPSADLTATTTAAISFLDRSTMIPEVQNKNGIFSFDLTWAEIQTLKPQTVSLFDGPLARNPLHKNAGKIVTLAEFLDLAKTRAVPGVLINIHSAAYLASKKGLDMVGAITTALSNASFDKQPNQKVLIQSDDSSVLSKFQDVKTYQRVLALREDISGATKETAQQVKKYADAVNVARNSIITSYPPPIFMSNGITNVVDIMHAENISVYVGILRNEFQNFLFDYYADPYVELATFAQYELDGIITDFPATASAYMKSPCSDSNSNLPFIIMGITPGDLFSGIGIPAPPQAAPSMPLLQDSDIVDPPLPAVAKVTDSAAPGSPADAGSTPAQEAKSSSSTPTTPTNPILTIAAMVAVLTVLCSNIKHYF